MFIVINPIALIILHMGLIPTILMRQVPHVYFHLLWDWSHWIYFHAYGTDPNCTFLFVGLVPRGTFLCAWDWSGLMTISNIGTSPIPDFFLPEHRLGENFDCKSRLCMVLVLLISFCPVYCCRDPGIAHPCQSAMGTGRCTKSRTRQVLVLVSNENSVEFKINIQSRSFIKFQYFKPVVFQFQCNQYSLWKCYA
jgi:hypothetical protein